MLAAALHRLGGLVSLALCALLASLCASSALAAADATQPRQRVAQYCEGCHTAHGPADDADDATAYRVPAVRMDRFLRGAHAFVPCQDCHTAGYETFPHRSISIQRCMDCHPRSDAAGARADAAHRFEPVAQSLVDSVHFTGTLDLFRTAGEGAPDGNAADSLQCSACHHAHYMQAAERVGSWQDLRIEHDGGCTSCHAAEPRRPPDLILAMDWSDLARPASPGLSAEHAALPHAGLHLQAVRCVDCHARPGQPDSHVVLAGKQARQCTACHAAGTILQDLLRHEAAPPATSGFRNANLLSAAYVMGATRHRGLDALFLWVLGGVAVAIAGHALWRLLRRGRE